MKFLPLYIDPGSGSMLLQVIIGACLGVVFFFKTIVFRIKSLFRKNKKEDNSNSASGL